MALYDLTDNNKKLIEEILKKFTIQADFEGRQEFDKQIRDILIKLENPIENKK